jgi:hypothetical protein
MVCTIGYLRKGKICLPQHMATNGTTYKLSDFGTLENEIPMLIAMHGAMVDGQHLLLLKPTPAAAEANTCCC